MNENSIFFAITTLELAIQKNCRKLRPAVILTYCFFEYAFRMADTMEERLRTHVEEVKNRVKCQLDDRKKLESAVPLSEEQLRKMDSALKRTTAFMKKLKNIGCIQLSSILQDIDKVSYPFFYLWY